jgi:hypothetical protein
MDETLLEIQHADDGDLVDYPLPSIFNSAAKITDPRLEETDNDVPGNVEEIDSFFP